MLRSIRWVLGRGVLVVVVGWVDWIVLWTNWAIWGQTRGVLVLQIIMPILGGVVVGVAMMDIG